MASAPGADSALQLTGGQLKLFHYARMPSTLRARLREIVALGPPKKKGHKRSKGRDVPRSPPQRTARECLLHGQDLTEDGYIRYSIQPRPVGAGQASELRFEATDEEKIKWDLSTMLLAATGNNPTFKPHMLGAMDSLWKGIYRGDEVSFSDAFQPALLCLPAMQSFPGKALRQSPASWIQSVPLCA